MTPKLPPPVIILEDNISMEELRLRLWARRNYVPGNERNPAWHPCVVDEMRRQDAELAGESAEVIPESSSDAAYYSSPEFGRVLENHMRAIRAEIAVEQSPAKHQPSGK